MRILLATDGTGPSAGAVRLAISLAAAPDARVGVLHVLEPLTAQGPPSARLLVSPDPGFAEQRKAAAATRLKTWLRDFGPTAAEWPVEIRIGPVPATIVRAAEADGATLIVVGSGRHDRLERWFRTETALRVIQISHLPVLAVPEAAGGRPRTVLAAVDFSDFSRRAVSQAIGLCEPGAELHLAHVLWQRPYDMEGLDEGWTEQLRERNREDLEEWASALEGVSSVRPVMHHLEGSAPEELLKLADRIGADLIAAGSHGMGFLGRLLLGSVSTRLLRAATCPVLIAPPPERARELDDEPARAGAPYAG
jgi:nucleotide-binding universal stress UspA family protein